VLKKLGMRRDEINIILSACDQNKDGFFDAFELDQLRLLARHARSVHSMNVRRKAEDTDRQPGHPFLSLLGNGHHKICLVM